MLNVLIFLLNQRIMTININYEFRDSKHTR